MWAWLRRLLAPPATPLAGTPDEIPGCQACWLEWINDTYLQYEEVQWYPDEQLCDPHQDRAAIGRRLSEDPRPRQDDD